MMFRKYNKLAANPLSMKPWNMKRSITIITCVLMTFVVTKGYTQVYDGLYRALTNPQSARVVALGGIPLPMHDGDLQTVTFNPSSICPSMNNQLSLSYVGDFKLGTNYATAQYSHTFDKVGSFAATVQYENYGAMQYASESGSTDGSTFNVSDYVVALGWGRELTDKWSIGANLKYVGIQYESSRAGALGVDVAATYWSYTNWAFTLAARNIGHQLFIVDMQNDEQWLPFSLDFIASKKLNHLPLTFVLGFRDMTHWDKYYDDPLHLYDTYDPTTGDYTEPSKFAKIATNVCSHLVVGGELEIGKVLSIRASYNYANHHNMDVPEKRTLMGFAAGFGVKIKAFQFDYAYSFSNIVGSPHYFSLRLDLSKF